MHLGRGRSPRKRVHVDTDRSEEDAKRLYHDADDDDYNNYDQDDSEIDLVEQFYDQQDDSHLYSCPHRLLR